MTLPVRLEKGDPKDGGSRLGRSLQRWERHPKALRVRQLLALHVLPVGGTEAGRDVPRTGTAIPSTTHVNRVLGRRCSLAPEREAVGAPGCRGLLASWAHRPDQLPGGPGKGHSQPIALLWAPWEPAPECSRMLQVCLMALLPSTSLLTGDSDVADRMDGVVTATALPPSAGAVSGGG